MAVPTFIQSKVSRKRRYSVYVAALAVILGGFFSLATPSVLRQGSVRCWQTNAAVYRDVRECLAPLFAATVPTFIQTKTAASDASAGTSHPITPDSAIRSQGGTIGPSTGVVMCSFDGDPGTVTATDTLGNTWQQGTSAGSGTTYGNILYSFNMTPGAVTITVATTNSVKCKLAFAELDQVAPISPYDGTSTPLDKTQERVDTPAAATTIRTSSPASPAPPKMTGSKGVRIGGMAWNNTKTVSSTSAWTGLVQLSGGSSNLGVAIERKAVEIENISGANSRASFTMSASDTQPSAVMSLTFYRDGVMTGTSEEGDIENLESVLTENHNSTSFIYRSSASAPTGGTGGSTYQSAFGFLPRYYKPTGTTIADAYTLRYVLSDGYDDGLGYFVFYYDAFANDEAGATLETTDWNVGGVPLNNPTALGVDANVFGSKLLTLSRATDWNDDGTSAIKFTEEGDGNSMGTSNYMNIANYAGNNPMYVQFTLTYPSLAVPQRTLLGVGT